MALGSNATTLSSLDAEGILPKPLVGEILKRVQHESVVMRVAGTTPVSITGNTIATAVGNPVAGIVGEGEAKPVVKGGVKLKTFKPIKAAALMYWSKEARIANPAGYLDNFVEQLTGAVTQAVDMAVIHGKNALTGAEISGVEYLTQTKNTVELGTAAAASGGLGADFLAGMSPVADAGYDFNALIADSRLRPKLIGATDTTGRPLYQGNLDLTSKVDSMFGLPITYSKAVSGAIGAVEDTKIRAIGGDFDKNVKLGFVEQINFKRTDTATLNDGGTTINLWQQNMEAILVEAIFGWVITDVNAFTKYTDAV